ncbi:MULTISPECIES: hypothetical protein [Spirosoma]|uniref:DUF2306 domain-containing protein n=1 Tax=Spirosoma sordidisoli TaxID=2502893 RepID=A0A4Q2UJ05_9BACT|nr:MULTISPECIES: hypothetical protein [Spirosoma]RYC67531.1 hypothetical protein EQG79_22735 [Spirosoma sordidisoli]
METIYKNSYYLFLAILLMVFVGFYRTYFGLFPRFEGLSLAMHFHAVMVLLWIGVLVAQPILIRRGQFAWHRKLGRLSYGLVPLMVLSIVILMRQVFMRPFVPGSFDTNMIAMADLSFFGLTYGLAIYYRHKVSYHARYMVLTALPFINPALGRLGLPGPLLGLVIMFGLLLYERFHNRVYQPYLLAIPVYIGIYIFFLAVITRADWMRIWWMFF